MDGYLRQATAAQSRTVGPFISDTDFKTVQTALTIANTDIKLMANGAASASKNAGGGTHRQSGHYGVTFDATDTATVGELTGSVVVAGALPVWFKFVVLEEVVYDALFGAAAPGYLQPATAGRQLVVDAAGLADANMVKAGPTGAGTAQTTGDIFARIGAPAGASIAADVAAVKVDTAAIKVQSDKLTFTVANHLDVNVLKWIGGTIPAVNVTGVPLVDLKYTLGTISAGAAGSVRADAVTGAVGSVTGAVGSVTGAVGSVTGNVGGNVVGTVASVVGAVGSVTGNVGGNVVGSVASVTARVTANTDQLAGQAVTAAAGVTFPTSVASPTNITAGVITTATNLTNAPTAGDFTAAMKTSLNAATPAVTVSDKTGFSLSAAGVQAIWDALTSALTTVGSIGKWIVDKLDVVVSTRLASSGYTAPLDATATANAVWDATSASHVTAGTTGKKLSDAAAAGTPPTAAAIADEVQTRTIAAVTTVNGLAANSVTAAALAADAGTEIGTAVWASATRRLSDGTNIVLAKGVGLTGLNDLSAAQVNAEADTALADAGVTTVAMAHLDADVSSRLATSGYTAPDNADIVIAAAAAASAATNASTLVGRLTSTRAGLLDNLDVAVSTRLATSGYTAPDNAGIATAADAATDAAADADVLLTRLTGQRATNLDNLDAAVSSRAATGAAMTLTIAERASVADKILGRSLAGGDDGGRTVQDALRALRNKASIVNDVLTVTEEDDTTTAWTGTVTRAAGDPITAIDPT